MIARPRWGDTLLLTTLVTVACGVALMQTEEGRQALVDEWERTAIAFGQPVDDARYAQFQDWSERGAWYAAVRAVAAGPLLAFGLSAAIRASFRGAATFRQVLAVVVHAGVILALRQALSAPINFVHETTASPTTMVLFFRMVDEASPVARFFGLIDLFVVWWIVVLATGVAMVYRWPARRLVAVFAGVYVAFALLLAIAMAVMGGTGAAVE